MNLHKNARTCPKSRALMVSRVLEDGRPVAVVAEEFGVSRRTVYKWVQRYCEAGYQLNLSYPVGKDLCPFEDSNGLSKPS